MGKTFQYVILIDGEYDNNDLCYKTIDGDFGSTFLNDELDQYGKCILSRDKILRRIKNCIESYGYQEDFNYYLGHRIYALSTLLKNMSDSDKVEILYC
jgi:hypothetical protein